MLPHLSTHAHDPLAVRRVAARGGVESPEGSPTGGGQTMQQLSQGGLKVVPVWGAGLAAA